MTTETEHDEPWLRDQKGELRKDYVVIDGVTLPGVLAREVAVQYTEDPKAEWPIKLTLSFYLDELDVAEEIEEMVDFTMTLKHPPAFPVDNEDDEDAGE